MAKSIYGLIGKNISYSISPVMHNAAFRHFNINAEYRLFDVQEDDLEEFIDSEFSKGVVKGVNVTVPYKVQVKEFLEFYSDKKVQFDGFVNTVGSINTIKIGKDFVQAFNTDVLGFEEALEKDANIQLEGKTFYVAGAGGAGRALSIFLTGIKNAGSVYVYDVDNEKLDSLKEQTGSMQLADRLKIIKEKSEQEEALSQSDIAINATPIGVKQDDPFPFDPGKMKHDAVVYDLIYARETKLIASAKEKGLIALNGLGMLVNQGAIAFNIWTGEPLSEIKEVMKSAAEKEIKERG